MVSIDSSFYFFFFGENEAADASKLVDNIMATAASFQPIALHTVAPGFYTRVKLWVWRTGTSGYPAFKTKFFE